MLCRSGLIQKYNNANSKIGAPVHPILERVRQEHQDGCHRRQRQQEQARQALEVQDEQVGRKMGFLARVRGWHARVAVLHLLHRGGVYRGVFFYDLYRHIL